MNNNDKGFTIVELVVVIILLSVLAVSALPKLFDSPEISATTDRDQAIALLLSTQTRAMQNTENFQNPFGPSGKKCHKVRFTATEIGMIAQDSLGKCSNNFVTSVDQTNDFLRIKPITPFTVRDGNNGTITEVYFNNFGQPVNSNNASLGRVRATFGSESLCIESQGYIHVCP